MLIITIKIQKKQSRTICFGAIVQ